MGVLNRGYLTFCSHPSASVGEAGSSICFGPQYPWMLKPGLALHTSGSASGIQQPWIYVPVVCQLCLLNTRHCAEKAACVLSFNPFSHFYWLDYWYFHCSFMDERLNSKVTQPIINLPYIADVKELTLMSYWSVLTVYWPLDSKVGTIFQAYLLQIWTPW